MLCQYHPLWFSGNWPSIITISRKHCTMNVIWWYVNTYGWGWYYLRIIDVVIDLWVWSRLYIRWPKKKKILNCVGVVSICSHFLTVQVKAVFYTFRLKLIKYSNLHWHLTNYLYDLWSRVKCAEVGSFNCFFFFVTGNRCTNLKTIKLSTVC